MNASSKKSIMLLLVVFVLILNLFGSSPAGALSPLVYVPLSLPAGYTLGHLDDIWGSSASDVYVAGIGNIPGYLDRPLLYHKQGAAWSIVNLAIPPGAMEVGLMSIWGSGANDVYAAGYHYDANGNGFPIIYQTTDGTNWTRSSPPLPVGRVEGNLNEIWGLSASNIYAVGTAREENFSARPLIYHKTGGNWTPISPPFDDWWTGGSLVDIWGSSTSNLYAVGSASNAYVDLHYPLLYRNTGAGWMKAEFSLPNGFSDGWLSSVWGTSANDVYILGSGPNSGGYYKPFVSHTNNGIDWTHTILPLPEGLVGFGTGRIWGSSANDVYLVGAGYDENNLARPVLYHNDGTGWTERMVYLPAEFSEGSLAGVWGSGANDLFLAGIGNDPEFGKPLLYRTSLSGELRVISGNAGAPGVMITYTGGSTFTDSNGNYSISVVPGWSGTVTPSKANYSFSPPNRTYTNVTTNQNAQNYTATRVYSISGNTGVGGVTLSYINGTPKTVISQANGSYAFQVPGGWSGTVIPSKNGYRFSPVNRSYTNVTVNQTGQNYTATRVYSISGNVGVAGAILSYLDGTARTVKSEANGNYSIVVPENWSGTVTSSHACFTFDPVDLSYTNIAGAQTAQDYTPTIKSGCADVNVSIGGVDQARYGIAALGSTRASYAGLDRGPVKVESTNAIPLMSAERVIYKVNNVNTSFSEMMALPDSQLDTTYWLPWYNSVSLNTQLRIANVSNADANIQVVIGGTPMGSFTLAAGASARKNYTSIDKGPVQIISDHGLPIIAAERVIYSVNGVNTSYSELMALPSSQLDTTYWLPWYNSKSLDTQLRIANVSPGEVTVTVTIGGAPAPGSPFTLALGASKRLSFPDIDKGPVKIESTGQVIASERVIYKLNGAGVSFSETMALPNSQLDTTYWLPWYNNKSTDSQLRIANVSDTEATVNVSIGGAPVTGSPFTIPAGGSKRLSFAGIDKGPVKIESNVNVVAAERVIYRVNNIVTSFSEMMGLPHGSLDTIYWLPWYNNKDLDTQLRFGVP